MNGENMPEKPKAMYFGEKLTEWDYSTVIKTIVVSYIFGLMILPCLCMAGTVKMVFFTSITLVFSLRVVFAKLRKERNNNWKIYCALAVAAPFFVEFVAGH